MNELKFIEGSITAPKGFKASGIWCGLRRNKTKKDLALIVSDVVCNAAAIYTTNKVYGAPINVTRKNLTDGKARAIICNSGNANTCAANGVAHAQAMCDKLGESLNISPSDVIVASTGVIGQELNINAILNGIPSLVSALSQQGDDDATMAIMTTDLAKKQSAVEFTLGEKTIRIGGIAKGSGMICPNMATMLSFITTDAAITAEMLHRALIKCAANTFNCVSVDGDTSTNDTLAIMANGLSGNDLIDKDGLDFDVFCDALFEVCHDLSMKMAKDGEGATKLVECRISGAKTMKDAQIMAKSVINSTLFKAAMFGSDANWGRVLCAMGYSGADFDPESVDVSFASDNGKIKVCKNGAGLEFDEDHAKEILLADKVSVVIELSESSGSAVAWGCDLSYDYVKINGDYRT